MAILDFFGITFAARAVIVEGGEISLGGLTTTDSYLGIYVGFDATFSVLYLYVSINL